MNVTAGHLLPDAHLSPIGVGAWRHRLDLVVAGVAREALLGTAAPPVEETFEFVEDAIEKELA